MKYKVLRYLLITFVVIAFLWTILTLWVEQRGPARRWSSGNTHGKKVVILYDPDPFYNLDEQVSLSLGKSLSNQGLQVNVMTVAAAEEDKIDTSPVALYIYCANTYNWRPDWAITDYIQKQKSMDGQPVVAITLGAGSTHESQKKLEELIINRGGKILASHSLWLLRPNDESKMEDPNVTVALEQAYQMGDHIAEQVNHMPVTP